VLDELLADRLLHVGSARTERRCSVDHIGHEVKAIAVEARFDRGRIIRRYRSIHSTKDPTPSSTNMTRKTRSLWYICFAPARASSTDV
jgi:hypothetical protein